MLMDTNGNTKKILIKDLCSRLPYRVKVQHLPSQIPLEILSINPNGVAWVTGDKGYPFEVDWKNCKPYLFPLSSMTEEQQKEYRKICDLDMEILENRPMKGEPFPAMYNSQDWLDAHHFDYRGLIPMGLAIDVTGLNIY